MTREPDAGTARLPLMPLPRPEDGFDPTNARPDLLARYGLPGPRPEDGPAAAAFRRAFLAPPPGRALRFAEAEAAPRARTLAATTAPPRGTVPGRGSANWSGGSLTALGGRSLVGVMARWRVPTVTRPPGGTDGPARASTWIGLDGQGVYRNASLPQIGTLQACDGAGERYETWVQWWTREAPTAPLTLGLAVAPGDAVSAILTVLDPATVRFNLKNETTGTVLQAFDVAAPGGRHVSGATAAWILERPSPPGSDGWHPYPLAAYGAFRFDACLAQSRGPGETAPTEHDLARAGLIRMTAIEGSCLRTISSPARVPGDPRALRLTYGAPLTPPPPAA
ncbi:hypothetical protein FF100_06305 [Methylobacterium terricola]|uniref:Peptidase A4 family protein n=1 Tax=Methylobacterium terricola TaxID=2583531 RepID=A0A5C4LML4_9HYPH|nr:G1 family glutamic endopeptidase [Methylobacterium terricola]TNC15165.1 hypothetical protein FF100_06305 [Methylobacterium terricola]